MQGRGFFTLVLVLIMLVGILAIVSGGLRIGQLMGEVPARVAVMSGGVSILSGLVLTGFAVLGFVLMHIAEALDDLRTSAMHRDKAKAEAAKLAAAQPIETYRGFDLVRRADRVIIRGQPGSYASVEQARLYLDRS